MEVNQAAFLHICNDAAIMPHERWSIGTYKEKKLHLILKRYFESDSAYHEVPFQGYVADIKRGAEIIEIQTSSLAGLRGKLGRYVTDAHVTVVYPIAIEKRILWLDPVSGEITAGRRSPRPQTLYSLLCEMIYIKEFLCRPALTVMAACLSVDEYRLLNGRGADRKKGAERLERIPTALHAFHSFQKAADFAALVPFEEGVPFTQKEYTVASTLGGRQLWAAIQTLLHVGVIEKVAKDGRKNQYVKRPTYPAGE